MGIKGLTTYINKNLRGAAPVEELREGDTLAIDGMGWLFQILRGQRVDHGGDYDLLHEATLREVDRLRQGGVNLRVYMDGQTRKMKAATRERRRQNIADSFTRLYGYTLDGGGALAGEGATHGGGGGSDAKRPDLSVSSFPLPKMASKQFAASLASAGVEIVECAGEADPEVARASADDPSGRTFAVGSDSDYFMFEGCRYVRYDFIEMLPDGRIQAKVWTRARLAELCGISEAQAVEWALLMGNDYTEGMSFYKKCVGRRPDKMLEWLQAQAPDFQVDPRAAIGAPAASSEQGEGYDGGGGGSCPEETTNTGASATAATAAASAIQFSRALYALQPLDRFPDDSDEDDDETLAAEAGAIPRLTLTSSSDIGGDGGGGASVHRSSHAHAGVGFRDAAAATAATTGSGGHSEGYGGAGGSGHAGATGTNRRMRRLMERKGRKRKGRGTPEGGRGTSGHDMGKRGKKPGRPPTELEVREAELKDQLMRRPFGEAAMEALQRTLDQVEEVPGGGRIWSSPTGGILGGERISAEERENLFIEAGARRTALWSVALGIRMELPESVRVKWVDVLLAIRYQANLLEAYRSRGLDRAVAFAADPVEGTKRAANDESSPQPLMPLQHFHGPTFHALLHDYRTKNGGDKTATEPAAKGISPEITSNSTTAVATNTTDVASNTGSGRGGRHQAPASSLPIDAHREEILEHVRNNRVTVIHGETGSGKSSRLPVMLVDDAVDRGGGDGRGGGTRARVLVSQPRRAATRALAQRVREEARGRMGKRGFKVGMRLGHGVREGPANPEVTFATTGYIVRLIANNPGVLNSHTHLIIDEVHERSVDTDLLCFFAKRLLDTHPKLKLIVMSATLSASLVSNYYGLDTPPLFVGSKRFPVKEVYVDELASVLGYRKVMKKACAGLISATSSLDGGPTPQILTVQHSLAVQVARQVGAPGSAVLIFVPGMASILAIMDLFELISSADVAYKVIPFHSELPKEEMMSAFEPAGEGVVKIVVATNSAESSITLPDVDNVICLGSCKQDCTGFSSKTKSRPGGSTQADEFGRTFGSVKTGRVRPGTVYRLYSRDMGETLMSEHGDSEIKRLPLDSLVLELKSMLADSPVLPVLESTLEPPDAESVRRSMQSLHAMGLLSTPDDVDAVMTDTGRFASGLGVDLQLGRMVALGRRLGMLPEAVAMAAVLSAPSTPFRKASHMVHGDPNEYNAIVGQSFMSQSLFDSGLYSDTLAVLRLLRDYVIRSKMGDVSRGAFCRLFHLSYTRMEQLAASAQSIAKRVSSLTGEPLPLVPGDPSTDPDLANVLRLLLVWTFPRNVIKLRTAKRYSSDGDTGAGADKSRPMELYLQGHAVSPEHLDDLLPDAYPGMKEISWRCSSAVYTHVYRTAARARRAPDAMASQLWTVANELLPQSPQGSLKSGTAGERGRRKKPGGHDRDLEGAGDGDGRASSERVVVDTSDGGSSPVATAGGRGGEVDPGRSGGSSKKGSPHGSTTAAALDHEGVRARREAASADAIVGLVYTLTKKTTDKFGNPWRRKAWDLKRNKPSVGDRRLCLVLTERFAEANKHRLAAWGIQGQKSLSRQLMHRELVENVGYVLTLDVQHTSGIMKSFRAFLGQRGAGVYAVTDAPMVQVEFSGDREPPIEVLPEVFGVDAPFEGGRAGAASQVVKFSRDITAGDCEPLVEDVPLGARILAAMANGSRQRKLKIWRDPDTRAEKVEVALSIPRNVWLTHDVSHAMSPVSSAPSPPSPSERGDNVGDIGYGSLPSSNATATRKRRGFVFAPPFSVAASVVPQGNERDVFAVASTIMHLPQANAVSDGLSLLPPGLSWLSRALLCAGAPVEGLPEGHELRDEQIDDAIKFSNTFWNTSSQETETSLRDYRAALRKIFEPEMGARNATHEGMDNEDANGGRPPTSGCDKEVLTRVHDGANAEQSAPVLAADPALDAAQVDDGGDNVGSDTGSRSSRMWRGNGATSAGTMPADAPSKAKTNAAEFSHEIPRGSPLAILKADRYLWGQGTQEKSGSEQRSRRAAAAVAKAARSASAAATAAARVAPTDPVHPLRAKELDFCLGKALMEWSGSLHAEGRRMAGLMAFQAVVMGIMSVHRRNVLAGCEGSLSPSPATADGRGRFVYGDLEKLRGDLHSATDVDDAIAKSARLAFGTAYADFGDDFERDGVKSVLRGVPWLSVDASGVITWRPPGPVAHALDSGNRDDPTAWMIGMGEHKPEPGGKKWRQYVAGLHPCLQQFEAYLSHRDDIDFATALSRAGLDGCALLLVSRVLASAATPEHAMGALRVDEFRDLRSLALRGGGSPPSAALLEEYSRKRYGVFGEPLLIHRFEELAGFLVGGTFGSLSPVGLPSAFDSVLRRTPGLPAGRVYERGSVTHALDASAGATTRGDAEAEASPPDARAHVAEALEEPDLQSLSRPKLCSSRGQDEYKVFNASIPGGDDGASISRALRGGRSVQTEGCGLSIRTRGDQERESYQGGVDSNQPSAFSPRFEAARFLVDLLGCRRGWASRPGELGKAGEGRQQLPQQQQPRLARGVEVRGGTALLVIAAMKRFQDFRNEATTSGGDEKQQGLSLERLCSEVDELCGREVGVSDVLEGLRAAPGVVTRGSGTAALYSWEYEGDVVQDLVVYVAGEEGASNVIQLQEYVAGALNLMAPEVCTASVKTKAKDSAKRTSRRRGPKGTRRSATDRVGPDLKSASLRRQSPHVQDAGWTIAAAEAPGPGKPGKPGVATARGAAVLSRKSTAIDGSKKTRQKKRASRRRPNSSGYAKT